MSDTKPEVKKSKWDSSDEDAPKWDYTSNRQNFITGAMVVGGNLLILILYSIMEENYL